MKVKIEPKSKLFLVNCGYYEKEILGGLFEMHVTLPIVAMDAATARARAKVYPFFVERGIHAHVDGIAELTEADGYRIELLKQGREGLQELTRNQEVSL